MDSTPGGAGKKWMTEVATLSESTEQPRIPGGFLAGSIAARVASRIRAWKASRGTPPSRDELVEQYRIVCNQVLRDLSPRRRANA